MNRTSHSAYLRDGSIRDADALIALDSVAAIDPGRAMQICEWLARGGVQVAEQNGKAAGYLVIHHHFFGAAFIEMLMVAHAQRGQGIGTALLRHTIARHGGSKLFTSTNASNIGMQRLLAANGFIDSGIVHGLDEAIRNSSTASRKTDQHLQNAQKKPTHCCAGFLIHHSGRDRGFEPPPPPPGIVADGAILLICEGFRPPIRLQKTQVAMNAIKQLRVDRVQSVEGTAADT